MVTGIESQTYVNELHFKSCFMHFGDMCETVFPITKARLEKFIACRKRSVNLKCEQADICRNSYNRKLHVDSK